MEERQALERLREVNINNMANGRLATTILCRVNGGTLKAGQLRKHLFCGFSSAGGTLAQ
jgi:hypothetical protein